MKQTDRNLKGQVAIMGLIFGFILVAIFSIILSPLLSFISIGVNATVGSTNEALMTTLIQSLPVFIGLMVLVAIVALITGRTS